MYCYCSVYVCFPKVDCRIDEWSSFKEQAMFMSQTSVCVCVLMCDVSPLGPLHASAHQAGEDGHHHFVVDLNQVLGQGVDLRSNLPRHGNGIPGAGRSRGWDHFSNVLDLWHSLYFLVSCLWRKCFNFKNIFLCCPAACSEFRRNIMPAMNKHKESR